MRGEYKKNDARINHVYVVYLPHCVLVWFYCILRAPHRLIFHVLVSHLSLCWMSMSIVKRLLSYFFLYFIELNFWVILKHISDTRHNHSVVVVVFAVITLIKIEVKKLLWTDAPHATDTWLIFISFCFHLFNAWHSHSRLAIVVLCIFLVMIMTIWWH